MDLRSVETCLYFDAYAEGGEDVTLPCGILICDAVEPLPQRVQRVHRHPQFVGQTRVDEPLDVRDVVARVQPEHRHGLLRSLVHGHVREARGDEDPHHGEDEAHVVLA